MPLPLVAIGVSAAITAFLGMVARAIPALIARAMVFLGIGFATLTGVQAGFDGLLNLVQGSLSNMPFAVVSILKLAGIPEAMSFIFSALAFKLSLRLVGGSMSFFSRKAPGGF